jgi:hypothetical protein
MRTASILAALTAALTITGGLAACSSSPPKAATAAPSPTPVFTDPNGQTCAPTALAGPNGAYCPGDTPQASALPTVNPVFTDPNGQTCAPSDVVFNGDCPDSASGGDSGSAPAPTMTKQTDKVVFKVRGSGYPSIQYGTDSWATVLPYPGRRP